MSQQSRSLDTQALFIATVGKHLMERGETALKLSGICTEVGMTQTAIYYHFGSREAVIDAAYLHLFDEITRASLLDWTSITSEKSSGDMYDRFVSLRDDFPSLELRQYHRTMHLRILTASTLRRPFKVKFDAANALYLTSLTELFEVTQDRGTLGKRFKARQFAMMVDYALVGQSLWNTSTSPEDRSDWDMVMRQLFEVVATS